MFRSLITGVGDERRKIDIHTCFCRWGWCCCHFETSHVMTPLRVSANCLELLSRPPNFQLCDNFLLNLYQDECSADGVKFYSRPRLSCGLAFSYIADGGGKFLLICIIWDICLISCWRQFTNCFRLEQEEVKKKKKAEINFAVHRHQMLCKKATDWESICSEKFDVKLSAIGANVGWNDKQFNFSPSIFTRSREFIVVVVVVSWFPTKSKCLPFPTMKQEQLRRQRVDKDDVPLLSDFFAYCAPKSASRTDPLCSRGRLVIEWNFRRMMYLFSSTIFTFWHFDIMTESAEDGNLVGRKIWITKKDSPSSHPSVERASLNRNVKKKLLLMFTCCCLHIALNCSLYSRQPFSDDEVLYRFACLRRPRPMSVEEKKIFS